MKNIAYLLLFLCICCGCYRQDVRTVGFDIPLMKSSDCSKVIQDSLMAFEGVIAAQPDFETRQMFVTYDSKKMANMNIEHQIAALGYDVNDMKADPAAKEKLPVDCR